jgi:3-hydroxyacyl-[acyl-carrier-protein] dehydratase
MLKEDFFKVLELVVEGNKVTSKIEINEKHAIFDGHFPGIPIVPGVCQIQIVNEIASEVLQQPLILKQARNIKFTNVIDPTKNRVIDVDLQIENKEEAFSVNALLFSGDSIFLKFKGLFVSEL